MTINNPTIGHWYRRPGGVMFEIVAIDEQAETIEIQQFDGTIGEYEAESWPELLCFEVSAPEDWSGSVDMDPEDSDATREAQMPLGFHDPLAFLNNL